MVDSQDATQSSPINKIPIMIVLISGAFVAILNQTLLATALPHIMRDLDIERCAMAAIYFYARERYYDPNYCFFNTTFYNKGIILDSNGLVCDRYSSLFRSTKFFAVDGR